MFVESELWLSSKKAVKMTTVVVVSMKNNVGGGAVSAG